MYQLLMCTHRQCTFPVFRNVMWLEVHTVYVEIRKVCHYVEQVYFYKNKKCFTYAVHLKILSTFYILLTCIPVCLK